MRVRVRVRISVRVRVRARVRVRVRVRVSDRAKRDLGLGQPWVARRLGADRRVRTPLVSREFRVRVEVRVRVRGSG